MSQNGLKIVFIAIQNTFFDLTTKQRSYIIFKLLKHFQVTIHQHLSLFMNSFHNCAFSLKNNHTFKWKAHNIKRWRNKQVNSFDIMKQHEQQKRWNNYYLEQNILSQNDLKMVLLYDVKVLSSKALVDWNKSVRTLILVICQYYSQSITHPLKKINQNFLCSHEMLVESQ